MLKFKEIKNSIIKNKYHGGTPHQEQPRYSYKITPKKAINQGFTRSPLTRRDSTRVEPYLYETSRKEPSQFVNYFQSDSKQNSYLNHCPSQPVIFANLTEKPLQFGPPSKRKIGHQHKPSIGNIYTDNQENTPKKSNISFASLLSSKKSSNQKCYGTERKDQRQSSISKLKDKLFGLKRVISDKQSQQSFVCLTPSKNQSKQECPTKREPTNPNPFNPDTNQFVNMSIRDGSPAHGELDMSPYLI